MSSSSVVTLSSFNLLFFTQVLTVLTSTLKYSEYVTDKGENVSIPCKADGDIIWVKEDINSSRIVRTEQELIFVNVSTADSGVYVCFVAVSPSTGSDVILKNDAYEPSSADYEAEKDGSTNVTAYNISKLNIDRKTAASSQQLASTTTPTSTLLISTTASTSTNATAGTASTTSPLPMPSVTIKVASKMLVNNNTTATTHNGEELEYEAFRKVNLSVRTAPGPVTQLYFKASTILGFLIWRFNKTHSGGYPVRSFTAEFRNVSYDVPPYNKSFEHQWSRMDPINIAPNVRQMEVYRLEPNTTYEFRIWANNQLGSGEVVTTNVTTLSETKEEGVEDGWDSIELIPNIILNPGFCESDGAHEAPYTRTIIFGEDDESDGYDSEESDHEPRIEKFKRKFSVFFTGPGPSIKRI